MCPPLGAAAPAPDEAPAFAAHTARLLGAEHAAAMAVRQRVYQAGLRWPAWIDQMPGRLGALLLDALDLPLALHRSHILATQAARLAEGIAALRRIFAITQVAIVTHDAALARQLGQQPLLHDVPCKVVPAVFPPRPEAAAALLGIPEPLRLHTVPIETALWVARLLRAEPARTHCSVVGAVHSPKVVDLPSATESTTPTPRMLVAQAGGSLHPAWVALLHHPLTGPLWDADRPLPPDTRVVYVLPPAHPLVRRVFAQSQPRAANACITCRLCTDACPVSALGTSPHLVLQAVARRAPLAQQIPFAQGCTGCGACSLACPASLHPGTLVASLATTTDQREPSVATRPLPTARTRTWSTALARLSLAPYAKTAAHERCTGPFPASPYGPAFSSG